MNETLVKLIKEYRELLKIRVKNYVCGKGAGKGRGLWVKNKIRKGNKSKLQILDFFEKNGRWPSRLSLHKREVKLAQRFENFVSLKGPSTDPEFRKIALASGRKSNHKRDHNVQEFKKEIIAFILENGRVPTSKSGEKIQGESNLRHKLDYYTDHAKDMTFLGEVYSLDRCHKSGVPMKFRPIINRSLDTEKPLVSLANYEIEGDL